MGKESPYKAVVIGASAGGMTVIRQLVGTLPEVFPMPVVIVQHIGASDTNYWPEIVGKAAHMIVKEADEKEKLKAGHIYLAPPNYHLLIENDHTFTLTTEDKVNYARPAIDILFETAADAYRKSLVGIVLTGANFDGAAGLKYIKSKGGLTIVQSPDSAESSAMPKTAIATADPDYILSPDEIINVLLNLPTLPRGMSAQLKNKKDKEKNGNSINI